jgi:hypothetical protein
VRRCVSHSAGKSDLLGQTGTPFHRTPWPNCDPGLRFATACVTRPCLSMNGLQYKKNVKTVELGTKYIACSSFLLRLVSQPVAINCILADRISVCILMLVSIDSSQVMGQTSL